jgi:hypothetical protein
MMKTHVVATLLLGALSVPAYADQITLGNSTSGSYDFTGHPPNIGVTSPGLTGHAFYRADTGIYTFGTTNFSAGPLVSGIYAANGHQSLTVTFADGDTATGDFNILQVKDGSNAPDFLGKWHVASSSGDADFLADFAAGSIADLDLVVVVKQAIDSLFEGLSEITQLVSSGQAIPGSTPPPPIPEPASTLLLLGTALGMLGLWRRYERP